jgi:type IV secretory pathway TraG/TraD family ATPase VirD4
MKNDDRFRHFYVIGQTGTGKSSIIQTMARQDFHNGKGICIVDPHGSLIEDLFAYIPRHRADDVIYFNPADTERPMGLNMLEAKTDEERDLIALDAMSMMVKMFGEEIFGPRIQDYFRNGCLTLMADQDEGGAITDLVRLFTDDEWQKYKVSKVHNPIVKSFWDKQMAQTGQRERQEMIPYFAAKFGQFTTNALIRNIVGQTKSSFDFSDIMNSGKILLMNLSKGLVGDINSKLLGMIIVNKIQVAAMRRQREEASKRRDFFLYIDEFQNYVTDSIESILSEARKYRLGLVIAHQYLDQLEKDSKLGGAVNLKGAVFGNVGTMMFYKIGPQDAEFCAKEMRPSFSESDLVNLDAFKGCMKLSIDSQPSQPFSIEVPKPWQDTTYAKDEKAVEAYKQLSRLKYGRDKEFVTREIIRRIGGSSMDSGAGIVNTAVAKPKASV